MDVKVVEEHLDVIKDFGRVQLEDTSLYFKLGMKMWEDRRHLLDYFKKQIDNAYSGDDYSQKAASLFVNRFLEISDMLIDNCKIQIIPKRVNEMSYRTSIDDMDFAHYYAEAKTVNLSGKNAYLWVNSIPELNGMKLIEDFFNSLRFTVNGHINLPNKVGEYMHFLFWWKFFLETNHEYCCICTRQKNTLLSKKSDFYCIACTRLMSGNYDSDLTEEQIFARKLRMYRPELHNQIPQISFKEIQARLSKYNIKL